MNELLDVLRHGALELEGRMMAASNATLFGTAELDGVTASCVYKPRRGERPLWDFPTGTLGRREVAAHDIAQLLDWPLIPLTVWRDDGPAGPGMCQLWVEADESQEAVRLVPRRRIPAGWRVVAEGEDSGGRGVCLVHDDCSDLQRLALLDVVLNNADRKGGHVLRTSEGELFGIDHGLTFHEDDKLRTVLWGWTDERVDSEDLEDLRRLQTHVEEGSLPESLEFLSVSEQRALNERLDHLLRTSVYPEAIVGWHALPWPVM